jgi:hypothetical protein
MSMGLSVRSQVSTTGMPLLRRRWRPWAERMIRSVPRRPDGGR